MANDNKTHSPFELLTVVEKSGCRGQVQKMKINMAFNGLAVFSFVYFEYLMAYAWMVRAKIHICTTTSFDFGQFIPFFFFVCFYSPMLSIHFHLVMNMSYGFSIDSFHFYFWSCVTQCVLLSRFSFTIAMCVVCWGPAIN